MCLVIKIRVVLLRRRMTIGNKIAISYIRRKLTCYFSSKRETKHNNEVQNECERNYQDCSQPELSESQRRKFLKSSGKLLLQGVTNTSSSSNICNSIYIACTLTGSSLGLEQTGSFPPWTVKMRNFFEELFGFILT